MNSRVGKSAAGETIHGDSIAAEVARVHNRTARGRGQEDLIEGRISVDCKSTSHHKALVHTWIEGEAQTWFDVLPVIVDLGKGGGG